MTYYPEPVNQFARLLHVSGPAVTGTYSLGSPWNNIRNGHDFDGENCMAAAFAVAADAQTGGKYRTSPNAIRNNQRDFSGGIGLDDGNEALRKLGQSILWTPGDADWADVMAWLRQGRFIVFAVDYRYVPSAYQEQVGGRFDHALGACGVRSDGTILRYDSLGRRARWVPQYAVRRAAEALSLRLVQTTRRLYVGVTDVIPSVVPYPPVAYRYGGQPIGRGRFLARRDNVPVRARPDPSAPKVAELDHRQDFACRQTVGSGDNVWLGTADGRRWVYRQVMWHSGALTGAEVIR